MSPLVWLVVAIVLLVVEILTPGVFFFACFGLGSLAAFGAASMGASIGVSLAVCFSVSFVFVLLVAPIARRWVKKGTSTPVGLDSLIGQRAWVIEAIDPITGKGQVRLPNGSVWIAICGQQVPEGTQVVINGIEGTRLAVAPFTDTSSTS